MEDESANYNWVSVISFIQKEYSKNSLQEKQWLFEKQALKDQNNRFQGEIRACETLQIDLLNRIRLLQIALMQEKSNNRNGIQGHGKQTKVLPGKMDLFNEHPLVYKKLRNQGHHQFLQKMMTDIGIKEIPEDPIPKNDSIHFVNQKGKLSLKSDVFLTLKLEQKNKIAGHLDSIQKMHKNPSSTFLATISQDCLIKLWPYPQLKTNFEVEPLIALRQHTGPLFSLSGGVSPFNPEETLLFTAGSQGCIKCWSIPDPYDLQKTNLSGSWPNSTDKKCEDHAIWQLQYKYQKLLSASSDGFIRLFGMVQQFQEGSGRSQILGQERGSFREKQFNQTCVDWVSERTFLTGCQNAPRITLWDIGGKICQKYLYQIDKNKEINQFQANCLKYMPQHKMIIAGCEDSCLRIFDFNSGKIIKKLKTSCSVSCLERRQEWEVVCGCHDGSLSVWDLRKFSISFLDSKSHIVKYDEGIRDILTDDGTILTSGADGIIKVYK